MKIKKKIESADYKFTPKPRRETKLERARRIKKEDLAEDEKLKEQGGTSEKKGIKAVSEEVELQSLLDRKTFANEIDWLLYKRKFRDEEYLIALASVLWHGLRGVDWPFAYYYKVTLEGRKILAEFRDNHNRRFTKGIEATGEVKYDYKAVRVLAEEAQNTVEAIEKGQLKKTKSGVWLP